MNAYKKFGEILPICSQDTETKFWHKSRAINMVQICKKMTKYNARLNIVNMNEYMKFCEIMSICSQDI